MPLRPAKISSASNHMNAQAGILSMMSVISVRTEMHPQKISLHLELARGADSLTLPRQPAVYPSKHHHRAGNTGGSPHGPGPPDPSADVDHRIGAAQDVSVTSAQLHLV